MTIQDLENLASHGFKRDAEAANPNRDELMACIEIKSKAAELTEELQHPERWDKEVIARKTSAIIWFCSRLAGMYGVNLEEAIRKFAEENKKLSPSSPEKPTGSPTIGKKRNEKTFTCRAENQGYYQKLANLENQEGHKALSPSHLRIIEFIGSYTRAKGCFASDSYINSETINARSPKTLRRHLQYLISIKALSLSKEGSKRILRLAEAPQDRVISQKNFRTQQGMPEYSYRKEYTKDLEEDVEIMEPRKEASMAAKDEVWDDSWLRNDEPKDQNQAKKEPIFLNSEANNFAEESANFAAEKANFAPILSKTKKNETKKELPPKVPPPTETDFGIEVSWGSDSAESLRDSDGQPNNRLPIAESLRFPETTKNSFEEKEEDFSEPLVKKFKIKRPKTRKEAQAEAMQKLGNGHIANPLGATDNRKRKMYWKRGTDFDEKGAVTTHQLWRHLVKLWNRAFGEASDGNSYLETMISTDRSAIEIQFNEISEVFIQVTNGVFQPNNRDLADYFSWFLDPQRISTLISTAKYDKGKGMPHFNLLKGAGFVLNFYNKVISKRQRESSIVPAGASKAEEALSKVEHIFKEFSQVVDDGYKFTKIMVQYGYALAAQYLHDEKGLDESNCRRRIILSMADFIKAVPNGKFAVEFLRKGLESTKKYEAYLKQESCIWFEWQEKTKDLIEIAIERSGVDINGTGTKEEKIS